MASMKFSDPQTYFPTFFVSEETRMIQETVHNFVNKEIMPVRHLLDDDMDRKLTTKIRQGMCDIGLQKLTFPKKYGGEGYSSTIGDCLISEELARGDVGIAVSYACNRWGWRPALSVNNEAVLSEFMPSFCSNEVKVCCYNMTEPGSSHGGGGSDIENPNFEATKLRTKAELKNNEWIINGSKLWATNSGDNDLQCVVCTIDPSLGLEGVVLIYVPYPWKGLSRGKEEKKCGCSTDSNVATYFDDVRVPKEWGIGPGGLAGKIFETQLLGLGTCAMAAGIVRGAFEILLDYSERRIVGDKPLNQHSTSAVLLANMAIALETIRSFYLTTAYMRDHMDQLSPSAKAFYPARVNMSKVYGPEAAAKVIADGMSMMGSYGYARDYNYEKYWRDSKMLTLWLGGVLLNRFNVCRGYYDLHL
jgi:alkylation response protein AidB-like acyl-CoA dehydrogenase